MKVLDLEGVAGERYKKAEVVREHTEGALYDEILTYRTLASLTLPDAITKFKAWAEWLEPGGVIHLFEPSAEWFGREIRGGRTNILTEVHLFGQESKPFRSAWTLAMLRDLLTMANLMPGIATTRPYVIGKADKQEIFAEEHYVVGVKAGGSRQWSPD